MLCARKVDDHFHVNCFALLVQLAYLYDQKSLVDQLEVTTEFGGTLNYNHKIWVYNRIVRQLLASREGRREGVLIGGDRGGGRRGREKRAIAGE